jgi:hypothetical protein
VTFLEAVVRIMRLNGHIRGDTDAPTSFADTAHNSTIQIAQLAIQDELTNLSADRSIPYEKSSTSVTLATGTRTYTLPGDFIGFFGVAHFYDATDNRQIFEFPGGLENIQLIDYQYATNTGTPMNWYWEPSSTKKVGFYQVPNSTYSGRVLTYDYETSILVTAASDTMPFHNAEEGNSFCAMAGRRFKYLFEDVKDTQDIQNILDNDLSYRTSKGTLLRLISGKNPPGRYAPMYR